MRWTNLIEVGEECLRRERSTSSRLQGRSTKREVFASIDSHGESCRHLPRFGEPPRSAKFTQFSRAIVILLTSRGAGILEVEVYVAGLVRPAPGRRPYTCASSSMLLHPPTDMTSSTGRLHLSPPVPLHIRRSLIRPRSRVFRQVADGSSYAGHLLHIHPLSRDQALAGAPS
jgi:hypothetical protein